LNPICTPIFTTTYKITASGLGNCFATDTIKVVALKVLAIPNVFSPNGDGQHDFWDIPFLKDYPGSKIEIFNRYGQLVYRSYGYNGPWDGNVNGKPVPIGTYYYIIELNNNGYGKISGSLTILR
jgi:gliding motility-associated-like protein